MADPMLAAPAALFVAVSAYAAAVAVQEPELPGEPLGIHVPGTVRTHLLLGLGSGVSAPWPMPVAAAWAALRGQPGSTGAARTVAGVGTALILGTLVEPVTWGRRPASRRAAATVPLHLLTGVAMVSAGTHRLRQLGQPGRA
ncbi:hypothetical protein [Ornithinimicrobium cerasi]|uniref:Uncharacterized protein n=1 Tax=Ornithinimicrobium cerasi TaxID=2248773 RepID=A0A285VHP4_9MICO|nr:hypothetical protein [Ornithinimicrobium cerasi]SOC53570.1 hypothetical protein SAMN05421879_10225 [Ornithinimicrobium cerasi]